MSASPPPFDPASQCDAMAAAMGLTITPEQRPGVIQYLAVAHRMAALVATAPHSDAEFALAAVFQPDAPDGGEMA